MGRSRHGQRRRIIEAEIAAQIKKETPTPTYTPEELEKAKELFNRIAQTINKTKTIISNDKDKRKIRQELNRLKLLLKWDEVDTESETDD